MSGYVAAVSAVVVPLLLAVGGCSDDDADLFASDDLDASESESTDASESNDLDLSGPADTGLFDVELWHSGPEGRAATYRHLDEVLTPGMHRSEVRDALGHPDYRDGTTAESADGTDAYRLPDGLADPEWVAIHYDDHDRYTDWAFVQG